MEDEIARSIAQALQRTLVGVKLGTSNLEAHDLYLKGRFFWNKRTAESLRRAAGFFEEAIRLDPRYALAHDGLADSLALQWEHDETASEDLILRAKQAALRALELDPEMAEAHASLGLIAYEQRQWSLALAEFRRAIELNPNYALAYKWAGLALMMTGRFQEARAEFERALQLDPIALSANANLGALLLHTRDYAGAIAQLRKTLEMDPAFRDARVGLVRVLSLQGKQVEALAELDRVEPAPELRALVLARAGRRAEALAVARAHEQRILGYWEFGDFAAAWMVLGDADKAFALLRRACALHRMPPDLKVSAAYDPMRSDPRFREQLRCANLD